ncbi:MAG: alkaline phosphatase family protein, partial [Flavobacteriaceae bacterium]|nr:alkaline phosphatase family protein [Flavobacteriaceae bacterium]
MSAQQKSNSDFVISFGSCNKQYKQNLLWKEISKNNPDVWVWGGDVVYADTDNMPKLQKIYNQQSGQKEYQDFIQSVTVLGTWDDHDYGANDGGKDFYKKKESQQLFLDFIGVSKNDSRRNRAGVYHSQLFKTDKGSVKIIVLDTRYFRSGLTASE